MGCGMCGIKMGCGTCETCLVPELDPIVVVQVGPTEAMAASLLPPQKKACDDSGKNDNVGRLGVRLACQQLDTLGF